MFDWVYGMCEADIHTERDLNTQELRKTRVNLQDPCWIFFWMSCAASALASALWIFVGKSILWLSAPVLILILTAVVFLYVGANRFARIPEKYIAVRGFLGRAHLFRSCLLFFMRKWTQTVLIPLDVNANNSLKVDSLVRIPGDEHRTDMLETANFHLRWAAQLDPDRLQAVMDAFYDDLFREAQFELHHDEDNPDKQLKKCMESSSEVIRREIANWLGSTFDAFMSTQRYTIDEMVARLPDMSRELTQWFQREALVLGVNVLSVQIEKIDGTWVQQRERATKAELTAAADARESDAKRQTRVAAAAAEEAAGIRELERDRAIAETAVQTARERSKAAMANALIGLQPLRAKLRAVRNRELEVAATKMADMDALQFKTLLEEIAKAGHSEVHTLVTVGGNNGEIGDISSLVRLARPFIDSLSQATKTTKA